MLFRSILQEYVLYYGKVHVNTSQAANPVSDISTKGYDYLEMAEVMIKGAYPSVFTILVDDDNEKNPPQLLSFSYADVLTRDIRMKLC